MSKMKKFVFVKGVLDNFRQTVNTPSPTDGKGSVSGSAGHSSVPAKLEQDVVETLSPHLFTTETTVRHGFPFKPISVAFDPIQKLLAIGNREGSVRILGRPGIDVEIQHGNRQAQVS
jgi:syntaxin-binding protein 5